MALFEKYPSYESRAECVFQGGRGQYNHDMLPEVTAFDQHEVKHITYSGKKYSITEEWVTVRLPALTYEILQCCTADTPLFTCCTEPEHRGQSGQEKGG